MRHGQFLAATGTALSMSSFFNANLGNPPSTQYTNFGNESAREDIPAAACWPGEQGIVHETSTTAYSLFERKQDSISPTLSLNSYLLKSTSRSWRSESPATSVSFRNRSSNYPTSFASFAGSRSKSGNIASRRSVSVKFAEHPRLTRSSVERSESDYGDSERYLAKQS
jgi:hypothetical protein